MIPIPAEFYDLVYIILVILVAIPVLIKYGNGYTIYDFNRKEEPIWQSLLFTLVIITFIGLRPNSQVFADGPGYWNAILDKRWELLTLEESNYQFATQWLISTMSSYGIHPQLGFVIYSTVIYGGAFIAMRKIYPCDTLLAILLYCGTFGVFGFAVNGIKNGMASSMFLCAIAYKEKWYKYLPFLLLSIGFHHAMQINLCAFVLCKFYKKTNHYYLFWVFSFFIAALHITFFQTYLAGYTDEHGASYLLTDDFSEWMTGFRLDFVLYSAAPLALGWWVKSKINIIGSKYQFVLNVYLVMNSIWLLCMYSNFTNRIASLSWALFPMLILTPLLNERVSPNQHKVLFWFVIGQLAFTLIMANI